MGDNTKISYCHATVSPVRGCTPVSPGCVNCFAKGAARRFCGHLVDDDGRWTGEIELAPEQLEKPLRWSKKPRIILWETMGDIFHEQVPDEYIAACFGVMAATRHHTHLVLTKRIERAFQWLSPAGWLGSSCQIELGVQPLNVIGYWARGHRAEVGGRGMDPVGERFPLPNVVIGCTVEDDPNAIRRLCELAQVSQLGWRTWISIEPMLSCISLRDIPCNVPHPEHAGDDYFCALTGAGYDPQRRIWGDEHPHVCSSPAGTYGSIEFVAVGGETGPNARPCDTAWIDLIVEQCRDTDTRCHVKQLGKGERFTPAIWPRDLVRTGA